ncbi:hypothetical protein C8Q80DRAFT_1267217 [Daedaleopsis nitida]|nr:hypothetical protein C8Q80DRAFT_1267217 [Daedaleopsis nitida]
MLSSLSRLFQPSTSSLPLHHPRESDPLTRTDPGRNGGESTTTDGQHSSENTHGGRDPWPSTDAHSDSTPLLTRKPSSRLSSPPNTPSAMDTLYPAPPHVLWKTTGLQHSGQNSPTKSVGGLSMVLTTPTTPGWGAQPMNRSASSPSLLLSPSHASGSASRSHSPLAAHAHRPTSSLGRQSSRSVRLAVDSMYASEDSDAESEHSLRNGNGGHISLKQLSPIHEQQMPFPPHRKLSMDSVPRTPDSVRTFDRINGHNAFINRPLKRSLSQTSTSTHRSNMSSATPPVIPPLDLRPNFQNVMGVSHGPHSPSLAQPIPRKSRLPAPSLPTVVGSPRQTNKVSVIYEDGASARTSSFITAPSVSLATPIAEPGQRFSFGREHDFGNGPVYLDPSSFASDSARNSSETDARRTEETETDVTDATHRALPAGLYDTDLPGGATDGEQDYGQGHERRYSYGQPPLLAHSHSRPNSRASLRPGNPTPSSTHSRATTSSPSHSRPGSLLAVPVPRTRRRRDGDESFMENLEKRWLKGLSFGSGAFVHPPSARNRPRARAGLTCACLLFWVGFVMPWCWLIGGWLLTRAGEVPEEERGPLLPVWRADRRRDGHAKARRRDVDSGRREVAKARDAAAETGVKEGKRPDRPVPQADTAGDAAERRTKSKSWYPLLAPSVESLAPSDKSGGSMRRLKRYWPSSRRIDPWIRRCRIAAAVSGVLIFAAFVVAIVFVVLLHA